MSERTNEACKLIDQATDEELRVILRYLRQRVSVHPLEDEWATTAEAILTAIARSSDLTLRGVRGILAEAIFEETVLPEMELEGWRPVPIAGDQAYDFLLQKEESRVKIQVKLQRLEKGVPKRFAQHARGALQCPSAEMYVVEVQKTRSGVRKGAKTRPYRFGDFDILAVNLHPSTGDWKQFMFTVGDWLLPRKEESELIEIFQPVPTRPDNYWTDDLKTCISWFAARQRKRLYTS